jgi:hypothetical protein
MTAAGRIRRLAVLLALSAATAAAWSPPAPAAIYDVQLCRSSPPELPFINDRSLHLQLVDQCDAPSHSTLQRAIVVNQSDLSTLKVDGTQAWTLTAPVGTTLAGLEADRSIGGVWFADSVRWELRATPFLGANGIVFDSHQSNPSSSADFTNPPNVHLNLDILGIIGAGLPSVTSIFGCLHPVGNPCGSFREYGVTLGNIVAHLDDQFAPNFPTLNGSLFFDTSELRGTHELRVTTGDGGSGIASVTLRIDGQIANTRIETNGGRCVKPYRFLVPCPLIADQTFSVDTRTLADGDHTFEALITDAAGQTTSSGVIPFAVHNAPVNSGPPELTGLAVVGGQLSATTGTWDGSPSGFQFTWLRCPATVASAADGASCARIAGAPDAHLYTPTSADVGARIAVKITALNAGGSVAAFSAPTDVVPAPPGGGPDGNPPPPDTTAPALSGVSLSRARFPLSSRAGAALRLTSSEAGTLSILVERARPGRKVKRDGKVVCTAVRRPVARGRCTAYARAATLTRALAVGQTSVKIAARIGAKRLAPGKYRLTIAVRDAAGNVSQAKRLTFAILRG